MLDAGAQNSGSWKLGVNGSKDLRISLQTTTGPGTDGLCGCKTSRDGKTAHQSQQVHALYHTMFL